MTSRCLLRFDHYLLDAAKLALMCNEKVEALDVTQIHLELEAECHGATYNTYLVDQSGHKSRGRKHKSFDKGNGQLNEYGAPTKAKEQNVTKDNSKLKYYNCKKKDYFTWERAQPKKVYTTLIILLFVLSLMHQLLILTMTGLLIQSNKHAT